MAYTALFTKSNPSSEAPLQLYSPATPTTLLPAMESSPLSSLETPSARSICNLLALIKGMPGAATALKSILLGANFQSPPTQGAEGSTAGALATTTTTTKLAQAADNTTCGSANSPESSNTALVPTSASVTGKQRSSLAELGLLDLLESHLQSALAPTTTNRVVVEVRSDSPVLRPSHDGHHWRRYGRKLIKDAQFPRLYYKCMDETCDAKKQMQVVRTETAPEPRWVTAVTYESDHHPKCTRKDRHVHKMQQARERAPALAKEERASKGARFENEGSSYQEQCLLAPRSAWAKGLLGLHDTDVSEGRFEVASSQERSQTHCRSALSTAEGSPEPASCKERASLEECCTLGSREGLKRKAEDLCQDTSGCSGLRCTRQSQRDKVSCGEMESERRSVVRFRLFGQDLVMT